MGQDNLYLQIDSLRYFAQTHSDIVSGMAGLLDAGAHVAGVASTHGAIASAVHEALGGTMDARQGAHRVVSGTAGHLSESLAKAAHHYQQVGQHAAAAAKKAEAAIDQFAGGATGGGAGQALGQLGQLGSQLGQSLSGMFEHKGHGGSFGQLMQGAEQLAQGHADKAGEHPDAGQDHPGDGMSQPDDPSRPRFV